MSAEGGGVRPTPSVYCRCPDNCLHTSDCAVHNEPAEEAGNCTCMTPAQKRALPDAHYSHGRRYSRIRNAWILAEDWNDREEVARLNAALATLRARVAQLESALRDLHDDIVERFDMLNPSTNVGLVNAVEAARAALRGAP